MDDGRRTKGGGEEDEDGITRCGRRLERGKCGRPSRLRWRRRRPELVISIIFAIVIVLSPKTTEEVARTHLLTASLSNDTTAGGCVDLAACNRNGLSSSILTL